MFSLKQNDRLPQLRAVLLGADGFPIDLTGGSVSFKMRTASAGVLKVDASCTVEDATAGKVRYDWAAGDTDTVGTYRGEFLVTLSGRSMTVPNSGNITVEITSRL